MKMHKRKKFKGMTLIEILVALAIFALLGSILILAGMQIDRTMKGSNKLKRKMTTESVYAANQIENYVVSGTATAPFETQPITIEVKYNSTKVDINAYRVDTEKIVKPTGMTPQQQAAYDNSVNSKLNYKFIKIVEPTTAAPTT